MGVQANVTMSLDLGKITDQILADAVAGQNLAGERLLALSKDEVPYRDGPLSGSGQMEPASSPGEPTTVSYDAPYAARWHEDGGLVDSLGRTYNAGADFQNGRKSHYLSDPAVENRDELAAIIAKRAGAGG